MNQNKRYLFIHTLWAYYVHQVCSWLLAYWFAQLSSQSRIKHCRARLVLVTVLVCQFLAFLWGNNVNYPLGLIQCNFHFPCIKGPRPNLLLPLFCWRCCVPGWPCLCCWPFWPRLFWPIDDHDDHWLKPVLDDCKLLLWKGSGCCCIDCIIHDAIRRKKRTLDTPLA